MRIISGIYKGRRFYPPSKLTARPTTDFSKEGLFNVLSNFFSFEQKNVLDLFAGTGSITFECLSRGAQQVTAIELAHAQYSFIVQQRKVLNTNKIKVVKSDVFKYIREYKEMPDFQPYDFIFADPPYSLALLSSIPSVIFEDPSILNKEGIFVLEHSKHHHFSSNTFFLFERQYGNVHFSFFRNSKQ